MEFWIILGAAILLILSLPYLRLICKRISLAIRLKKACADASCRLIPARFLWFIGARSARGCDLYIETRREIIAVKLFSVLRKKNDLIFTEGGKYFIRRYVAVIAAGGGFRYPFDGRRRALPDYDFRRNFRPEWELKTPRKILLINPVCNEIKFRAPNGREQIIGTGQFVNNYQIMTLSRLIGELNG